jgi:hypothetical protein
MPPKPEPEEPEAPRTFWTTLPGLFTGMAAMLTALGALVAALGAAGLFSLPRNAASEERAPETRPDGTPEALGSTGEVSPTSAVPGDDAQNRTGD